MSSNNLTHSNYARLFRDKQFVTQLITTVRNQMGRHLIATEKMFIINFIKNIDPIIFNNKSPETVFRTMTQYIIDKLAKNKCQADEEQVDIHEILKSQIGMKSEEIAESNNDLNNNNLVDQITNTFSNQVDIVSILGNKNLTDLQRVINPTLVKRYNYIMLDTRYRLLEDDATTSFKWNFVNNEFTSQGSVNAIGDIKDIIGIRIFPIKIPYVSSADNEYKRISLFIKELSAQSFVAQENRRFHFIFCANPSGKWIDLKSENFNDGFFRFRSPISRLDSVTISFGSPLEPITFDIDRTTGSVTYDVTTTFTTLSDHNLETGDLVYISNFITGNNNNITNSTIRSSINKTTGHIINVSDSTNFSIEVDTSSITVVGAGTISTVITTPTITGIGTAFTTFFVVGDIIEILGVKYTILSITSATVLTLTTNYTGATAGGQAYSRNSAVAGLRPSLYFASKRIFIPMEIEYYG